MKKIKDFFYNISDIFIAILILVIACGIILWRMDSVIKYPSTILDNDPPHQSGENVDPTGGNEKPSTNTGSDVNDPSGEQAGEQTPGGEGDTEPSGDEDPVESLFDEEGKLKEAITVSMQGETATSLVKSLVQTGLFKDFDEYKQVCIDAGRTYDQVRGGSFKFKEGSTKQDIVTQITVK